MVKKLYLDGCSFTWGLNIDPEQRLEHLFKHNGGYIVGNYARPGKSNLAIAQDVFNNAQNYDTIVVGWTFATRFYLKYDNYDLDFLPSRTELDLPENRDTGIIDQAYGEFHKYFYTLYKEPYIDNLSDMLISYSYAYCNQLGKKVLFFSWEHRNVNFDLYKPYIHPQERLPCGHLTAQGTQRLFDTLQELINE